MSKQTCGDCRFNIGRACHRYPPQVLADEDGDDCGSAFPDVVDSAWCGEWQEKEPTVNEISQRNLDT